MPKSIKCQDCGARRENVRYANTRYCKSCRLLRDLLYVETEQRPCADCTRPFAPVNRKDTLCGDCNYGSIYTGRCFLCAQDEAELYRDGIAVCVKCIRVPANRKRIIAGLRKGQRERSANKVLA
jgi:hypothetical protein